MKNDMKNTSKRILLDILEVETYKEMFLQRRIGCKTGSMIVLQWERAFRVRFSDFKLLPSNGRGRVYL